MNIPKPTIKNEWNTGNIIQMVLVIAGGLGVFFLTRQDVALNAELIGQNDKAITRNERSISDIRTRLNTQERQSAVMNQQLATIIERLNEIKADLRARK